MTTTEPTAEGVIAQPCPTCGVQSGPCVSLRDGVSVLDDFHRARPDGYDELETDMCAQHGAQLIVDAGSNPGFTGAPIYWWTLACGCSQMDDSADNIGAVR